MSENDTIPRLKAPKGATDTHMHFYGPYARYPLAPESPNQPEEALPEAYRALQERLGLERVVIVQPAGYRFDNDCTMESLDTIGDTARAIVVVEPETSEARLDMMAATGARGIRVFMLPGGVYQWDDLARLDSMAGNIGWHLQLQCDGRLLVDLWSRLKDLRAQIVIDHTGKFLEPVKPEDPAFRILRRLVDDKGAYVKLSAPYETSKAGPPRFEDIGALARVLVRQAPERMLWATNWPHPSHAPQDEAMLLDTLLDWAPDEGWQRQILVENPAQLYGF